MRTASALVLTLALGAPLAQGQESSRTLVERLGSQLEHLENVTALLAQVKSADDAWRLQAPIEASLTRVAVLANEMTREPEPDPARMDEIEARIRKIEAATSRFQEELRRVRRDPAAWAAIRNHPIIVDAEKERCRSNLKHIGLGVTLYQMKNNEFPPPHGNPGFFQALLEGGHLADASVFVCPGRAVEPTSGGEAVSTTYATWSSGPKITAGLIARFGSRLPMAWDSTADCHPGVRHVLFHDGHVEARSEESFEDLMETWQGEEWKFVR